MKNITHFDKVSFEQFQKDFIQNFGVVANMKEIYTNILLPKRATKGSAGYDFFLPIDLELKPNTSIVIPTGIRCMMNEEFVLQIYPRSSLGFKYRLQLDNIVGIIDSDYYYAQNEGHILIKISNLSLENKIVELKKGEAFVQGIFLSYGKTIDDQTFTTRSGGIGSTNKK